MMAEQDLGICRKCGWEWPIGTGDASVYANKHGSRHEITKPPSLVCPFCGSSKVKIKKEQA